MTIITTIACLFAFYYFILFLIGLFRKFLLKREDVLFEGFIYHYYIDSKKISHCFVIFFIVVGSLIWGIYTSPQFHELIGSYNVKYMPDGQYAYYCEYKDEDGLSSVEPSVIYVNVDEDGRSYELKSVYEFDEIDEQIYLDKYTRVTIYSDWDENIDLKYDVKLLNKKAYINGLSEDTSLKMELSTVIVLLMSCSLVFFVMRTILDFIEIGKIRRE